MPFEKLTYSGTECNNYLYFCFSADAFDTQLVTTALKIEPTSTMHKKDPVPKSTAWKYEIEVGNQVDLESPLKSMIDLFESKVSEINDLKEQLGLTTRLQFVMDIDIHPDASTPYFGLNTRTIDFLSKTGTKVDFDLYKADTLGIITEDQM